MAASRVCIVCLPEWKREELLERVWRIHYTFSEFARRKLHQWASRDWRMACLDFVSMVVTQSRVAMFQLGEHPCFLDSVTLAQLCIFIAAASRQDLFDHFMFLWEVRRQRIERQKLRREAMKHLSFVCDAPETGRGEKA